MSDIRLYPSGTPATTDKVPFVDVTAGALKLCQRADLTADRLALTGGNLTGPVTLTLATAGTAGVSLKVTGDTQQRHIVLADGTQQWGSGAGTVDTNLYRSAAATLTTDGALVVNGASAQLAAVATTSAQLVLVAKVSGDSVNRLTVDATGKLQWGAGSGAVDTNLYRSAAGTLKTDGALVVGGATTAASLNVTGAAAAASLAVTGAFTAGSSALTVATTGTTAYSVAVTGDTVARYTVGGDGKLQWGPGGSTALDTNLYRSAAGTLKTDGALVVAGASLSIAANAAASGHLRLPSSTTIAGRNNANTADLTLLATTSADALLIGPTGSGAFFQGTFVSIGGNAANSGTIRVPNNSLLYWRNNANTANLGLWVNTSDQLEFSEAMNLKFGTTTGSSIGTGSTNKLAFYGATPIVQPANTVGIDDVLVNLGLRASGGTATFANSITTAGGTFASSASSFNLTSINGIVNINAAAANPQIFFNGGGVEYARFNGSGYLQMADAHHIQLGTTSGSKIGTTATQKLGFFGAAPIVQPSGTPAAATDLATVISLANSLRTSILNLGLAA